jgi:hypothetical protein
LDSVRGAAKARHAGAYVQTNLPQSDSALSMERFVELSGSRSPHESSTAARVPAARARGSKRAMVDAAYERTECRIGWSRVSKLLAALVVGDKLPWKLDRDGQPKWLIVVEVVDSTSCLVRYPDGKTEFLVDSE